IVGDCIFVGGDDGVMRSYNRLTGKVVDEWMIAPELATSTIRSGTSYDEKTGRLFFTGKEAKKIYSVRITADGKFDEASKLATDIAGQATTTPTVYNGRVYATSGTMTSGGGFDVFDARTLEKIYTVDMGGISQSTPVVNTAFATEENGHEVYIYVCLNNAQGSLVCLRDFEGNTEPLIQYKWDAPKIQYCTHSMVMDQYGMMYYKNDSKGFWALSSKGVSLNQPTAKIRLGEELALHPRVVTTNPGKNVSWVSTNPTAAPVDAAGVVKGVAAGKAQIVVEMEEGEFTDTCEVTVYTPLTGITLAQSNVEMNVGDDTALNITIAPAGSLEDLIWTSSDPTVITVNETGVVTAVMPGNATITVTTEDGRLTRACQVKAVPVAVTGVNIAASSTTVGKNGLQLTSTVLPQNATNKNVSWTSSDETIATVSETGKVTAVTPGNATITVTTEDGGFTASRTVTVNIVPVTGVSLNQNTLALVYNGANARLTATVTPANATIATVTYESTDETVATVSNYGWVYPQGVGTAKVIVRTVNGNFTDTCVVMVEDVPVAGISLNSDTLRIEDGKNKTLNVTFTPTAVSNKNLTWFSTDEAVATVSATYNGASVKPVGNGEALVFARSEDGGFTDTCVILVSNLAVNPVTGVIVSNKSITLTLGGSGRMLTAKVLPENATNKACTWESTDETVATVSAMGTVTAKAGGETKIIVKTVAGGFADTCMVTVKAASVPDDPDTPDDPTVAVTGVTLDKTTAELTVGGEALQLTATVLPVEATDKTVAWTSSNEAVATVSASGLVTAKAAGEADIMVTTNDGGFTAVCKVTVKAASVPDDPDTPDDPAIAVTGVTLDKTTAELTVGGEALQLTATVLPVEATDKTVAWTSSNEAVATVSATGLVTAVAAGEADITVTTTDGGFTAICKLTVKAAPTANEADLQAILTSVYPNPTTGTVYVEVAEPALLEVCGLDGRVVFRQEVGAGVETVRLEKSGVYVVRVTSGDRVSVKRVVRR
ncbi:MAG: Ig-like domain-containing protein, partial [Bacteroidales bacterium]|nr:Ig-like domain-containing protein [Bacteroidales bacterium]